MTEQLFTLSNFRASDEIEGWPLGRDKRGTAVFTHESNKKGQRISRQTPYKGGMSKPKSSTYYERICLADGSDGKTHMVGITGYGFISVLSCDMKLSDFSIQEKDDNYAEVMSAVRAVTNPEALKEQSNVARND